MSEGFVGVLDVERSNSNGQTSPCWSQEKVVEGHVICHPREVVVSRSVLVDRPEGIAPNGERLVLEAPAARRPNDLRGADPSDFSRRQRLSPARVPRCFLDVHGGGRWQVVTFAYE